jgi:hypothetical protein
MHARLMADYATGIKINLVIELYALDAEKIC